MGEPLIAVRVWDLPTRVFHWLLAVSVVASITTARIGGRAMDWHLRLGDLAFALLAFRLVWGFVGGRWSRFARFAPGPSTLLRYLRGHARAEERLDVGHSPLAALSVFALLGVLLLQVATGLFADDEIAVAGPWSHVVSQGTSAALTAWHRGPGQWLVIGLAALHVAAIGVWLAKRNNLVRPMLSGDKLLPSDVPASADNWRTRTAAALLFAACLAGVAWVAWPDV